MPKKVSPKDKRLKIVRVMVNDAELKAMILGQKKAKIKSLAEFIRLATLSYNNA